MRVRGHRETSSRGAQRIPSGAWLRAQRVGSERVALRRVAIIAAYTVIITLFLPEQWLHPYGPVPKNLPLLAAIWLLHVIDDNEPNNRSGDR